MPETSRISFPATLMASIAFALSLFLLVQHLRDEGRPPAPVDVVAPSSGDERAETMTRPEPRTASPVRSVEVDGSRRDERRAVLETAIRDLTERVEQLDARIAQIQGALAVVPREQVEEPPPPRSPEEIAQERLERVATARGVILDPRADERQKLDAWGDLRHSGEDAWDGATVAEMTHIGLTSADPDVRADVWRQADGDARSDALVPALLQALAQDGHRQAREEAAETLANYRDLPQVRMALEAAAAGDQEEDVRRQARNSLNRGR